MISFNTVNLTTKHKVRFIFNAVTHLTQTFMNIQFRPGMPPSFYSKGGRAWSQFCQCCSECIIFTPIKYFSIPIMAKARQIQLMVTMCENRLPISWLARNMVMWSWSEKMKSYQSAASDAIIVRGKAVKENSCLLFMNTMCHQKDPSKKCITTF